jgi:acetyl-CoA C-acetyltransferase
MARSGALGRPIVGHEPGRGIVPGHGGTAVGDVVRPVVVGAAQVANKDPERLAHPVDLIEDAVRLVVADAGADPLAHVGLVLSSPLSVFSDEDGGAMVAERLGLGAARTVQTTYSGAGPHKLLAQACRAIADGEVEAALIVGGIADSSVRNARRQGLPDPAKPTSVWSQGSDGATREDAEADIRRLERYRAMRPQAEGDAGVTMPVSIFALVESALAAAAGRTPDEQRVALGRLLVPFTEVAATRPDVAWFPQVRTADEIAGLGAGNRFVSEPYTKLMCSFPTIDLAAAVLVTSEDLADRIGVSSTRVHPWGLVAAPEPGPPSTWQEMHRSEALTAIAERLLTATRVDTAEIAGFDLYSCFPAAVQLAAAAFGVDPFRDPRPLTRTGGLPYFGGPGASYSLHGLVSTVEAVRADPGSISAVVGVGGSCNDFAAGLLSVDEPRAPGRWEEVPAITEALAARSVPSAQCVEGPAVVEAATVFHERGTGPVSAPVIARLPDGRRIGARAGDPQLPAELSRTQIVGREVVLTVVDGATTFRPV